ncbi:MAG: hypothetical protein IH989_08790 [Planctomycetes bacterium]|nr:hypothetical protein [Planctomycetota bacterium]
MAAATTTGPKKARRKSVRKKKTTGSAGRKRTKKSKSEVDASTASSAETTSPPEAESKAYDEQIGAHRRRMASTAAILTEMFGPFGESHADLWDRRAYLMIVALVYERLTADENELSTEELVVLSKVLAESRRAEAQSRKSHASDTGAADKASPIGELPENFAETVRQVYGTNFQMPERAKGG